MKNTILKLLALFLLLCLVTAGCDNDTPPLDPSIHINIYKTKNDYFNNVHINLKDGKVYYKPSLHGKVDLDENGEPHYRFRVKLHKGYILGIEESCTHAAFLSYTIEEYYNMENDPESPTIPSIVELTEHIIDQDPFTEFYTDPYSPAIFQRSDSTLINQIIDENELEKYFKRLK